MRIAAVLFTCGLALGTYTLNASSNAGLPDGWSLGGEAPRLYSADIDKSDSPSGKGSMVLRRIETIHSYGSARLTQSIPVAAYAGKRVRVSMHVRFQDAGNLQGSVFIGTGGVENQVALMGGDWQLYQNTVDLPTNITQLDIGVALKGPGSAKADRLELLVLGEAPAGLRMMATSSDPQWNSTDKDAK